MKTKSPRKLIENKWIALSGIDYGGSLCSFLRSEHLGLWVTWENNVWINGSVKIKTGKNAVYIWDFFAFSEDEFCQSNVPELTYLTRALSLNMLLDDNEELLK